MVKNFLFVFSCLFCFSHYSLAQNQFDQVLKLEELAQTYAEEIVIKDKRGKKVKTLSGKQMALLYAVYVAMREAAELHAEFFILSGDNPNAFATVGKINKDDDDEQNIIGINFGMLDMIGMDMDAAAAIIGHELAHLKLRHIDVAKEKAKNPSNNTGMFSAAATKYTRDAERDSDYLGVVWAIEAGYDPEGAVRVHEALYKLSKRRPGGFSGTHPSSIERITILKSLVRRLSR